MALKYYAYLSMVRTGIMWGHLRQADHLEDLGIDRRILDTTKIYFQEAGWETQIGLIWLGLGTVGGTCECDSNVQVPLSDSSAWS
jgi:hypothetical protein